jgi:hypothetical protein
MPDADAPANVGLSRSELHAIYKMLDLLNHFVHQPLHYDPPSIAELRQANLDSIDAIISLLGRRLADPACVVSQVTAVPESWLREILAVLFFFRFVTEQADREAMDHFGTLAYKQFVHRHYYRDFASLLSDHLCEEISESEWSPIDFLERSRGT